jgi:tetratricopeptide (TPR) repeat protein
LLKTLALASLFRTYGHDPALLIEAESLANEVIRIKPELTAIYGPLSQVYSFQGKLELAEETAKKFVHYAPDNPRSHFALGFFYGHTGQPAKAIAPYEEAVRLMPDFRAALFNLAVVCDVAKQHEQCTKWALTALPVFERHLKLHPDDEGHRVWYAVLLLFSGRKEDAHQVALYLKNAKDGYSLFNTACLLADLGDKPEALATFRKAIETGFRGLVNMKGFLTDEDKGIAQLLGTSEYEEVKRMVEQIEREHLTTTN